MTMGRRLVGALAGLAVLLVAAGVVGSIRANEGLIRARLVVDGVPLTVVRPVGDSGPRPGAVVVHGFAGSARLMQPFADTLARNGYVVVLPDLGGHGAATAPLSDPMSDVDAAVRTLRDRSDVDGDRIVLVGHSRGAAAVMSYASAHPEIAATVAISGVAPQSRPGNLLLLYGQWEFPGLAIAARDLLRRADPTAPVGPGQTYGSFVDGTARRADPVPGVEHVSILFSPVAHRWTLDWLDAAVQSAKPGGSRQPDPTEPARAAANVDAAQAETAQRSVHPLDRLWPAGLLLLGLLVGFVPLSIAVLRFGAASRGHGSSAEAAEAAEAAAGPSVISPAVLASLVGSAVPGAVAAGIAGVLTPDPVFGLAVGGYTAVVLLVFGLVALAGDRLLTNAGDRFLANAALRARRPSSNVATGVAIALLTVYATAMVAVPIHTGLTWVAPSPQRMPAVAVLLLAGWVLYAAAERLGAGRWYLHAAVVAVPLVLLGALAAVGLGPGFLALILPLLAGLLAIGVGVAAVLRRLAVPGWLAGVVAAAPFAWTTAATLPLT